MKSPRSGKKLIPHELDRFLILLTRTGNFTLACEQLGRQKSGLYKRRARDPLFDAQCKAAIRRFDARLPSLEKEGKGWVEPQRTGPTGTILSRYAGQPQLRRSKPGMLGRAGRRTFFETLGLTGNIRLAAFSAGVQPSSIHFRGRTDPQFAAEIRSAKAMAKEVLKFRLIEATAAFFDPPRSPSRAGRGQGEGAQSEGADGEDSVSDPFEGFTGKMSIRHALRLLDILERNAPPEPRPIADPFAERPRVRRKPPPPPAPPEPPKPEPAPEPEKPRRGEPRMRWL